MTAPGSTFRLSFLPAPHPKHWQIPWLCLQIFLQLAASLPASLPFWGHCHPSPSHWHHYLVDCSRCYTASPPSFIPLPQPRRKHRTRCRYRPCSCFSLHLDGTPNPHQALWCRAPACLSCSSPVTLGLAPWALFTSIFFKLPEQAKHFLTSGLSYVLFPLPGMLFPAPAVVSWLLLTFQVLAFLTSLLWILWHPSCYSFFIKN